MVRAKLAIVSLSAAIAFYAIVGGFLSVQKNVFAKGDPYVQLRIFGDVLRHIVKDYVDEPDLEKVRIGALRGLAEGLDPYSAYLTREQVKKYKPVSMEQPETGLVLSKVAGYIYVVSVLRGSAAEKAGLRSGDFIEYLLGFATRDISLYDAQELLSSAAGSEVEMKVFRRGRPYKVKFKAAKSVQPAIEASVLEPGIGYVRVTSLAEGKDLELADRLEELKSKGIYKLILDLRGTANGRISTAAAAANLFIGSGVLAKAIGQNETVAASFSAERSKCRFEGQLVLLIDKSTAGGGEVLAAAIASAKRGELVGERTFGAGSEQRLFELKDGSGLLLTVAKYADPNGKPFMGENPGLLPTVEVRSAEVSEALLPESEDQVIEEDSNYPPLPVEPAPTEDLQLKKALEVIKNQTQQPGERKVAGELSSPYGVPVPVNKRATRLGTRL
ncbi:MAG: S41 family peptidase [Acidobacteriota bacterium]|nr:S41 family peptidase [Blastocatellia bacterium]MDW8413219.1 S41 family peptidase [Acidobacteriota bacterium]